MLTLRLLPPRGTALRAALTALEVTTVLVTAHALLGGALPSLVWVAAMAAVVFGVGLVALRGRLRLRYAVPAAVAAQVLLHAWLTWLTPSAALMHGGHTHAALDPRMLAVHAVGGVATALLWRWRARVVEVAIAWLRLPQLPVPRLVRRTGASAAGAVAASVGVWVVAPRRGPPAGVVPA